jgi:nudix motif 8
LNAGDLSELRSLLHPFSRDLVKKRRKRSQYIDLDNGFDRKSLVVLQRFLHRMPRQVFHAAEKRASVVIPLCNVNGEAHILFEKRSTNMSHHKGEICFPGGMVEEGVDATVIQTSLREMEEEIGLEAELTEVLGILRCKWSEVASLTGVAVTPVIGYVFCYAIALPSYSCL